MRSLRSTRKVGDFRRVEFYAARSLGAAVPPRREVIVMLPQVIKCSKSLARFSVFFAIALLVPVSVNLTAPETARAQGCIPSSPQVCPVMRLTVNARNSTPSALYVGIQNQAPARVNAASTRANIGMTNTGDNALVEVFDVRGTLIHYNHYVVPRTISNRVTVNVVQTVHGGVAIYFSEN